MRCECFSARDPVAACMMAVEPNHLTTAGAKCQRQPNITWTGAC